MDPLFPYKPLCLPGQTHGLVKDFGGLGDGDARLGLVVVGTGQQQLADGFAQRGLRVALQAQVLALPEQSHQDVDNGFDQGGFDRHGGCLQWRSRSEERRVGKEWVGKFSSRWATYHYKKNKT